MTILALYLCLHSNCSEVIAFRNIDISDKILLEVMCINTSEISKKSLESIVKVSGDRIVTGYKRFKKVKAIEGYKKACERAAMHLSVISGGISLQGGTYAVKVRFRLIVFLIPILIGLLFLFIGRLNYMAKERDIPEYVNPEIPTVKVVEDYEGLYISIPGIRSSVVSKTSPQMEVYNPISNNCALVYEVFFKEEVIGKSGSIYPGQKESIALAIPFMEGCYEVKVVTKGISLDGKTEYNSLFQTVELTCV